MNQLACERAVRSIGNDDACVHCPLGVILLGSKYFCRNFLSHMKEEQLIKLVCDCQMLGDVRGFIREIDDCCLW